MRPLLWLNFALLPAFWALSGPLVGYGIYLGVIAFVPYAVLSAVAIVLARSMGYGKRVQFTALAIGAAIVWLALIQFALVLVAFGVLVFALPPGRWRPGVITALGAVVVTVVALQVMGVFDDETYAYPQRGEQQRDLSRTLELMWPFFVHIGLVLFLVFVFAVRSIGLATGAQRLGTSRLDPGATEPPAPAR